MRERSSSHWSGAPHGSLTGGSATGSRRFRWRQLSIGDHVLVRQGEVVPVDGLVMSGEAVLDESALTGEAAAGFVQAGSAGPQRNGERRRRVRAAGDATRIRERVRRRRPSRSRGRESQGSVRPHGRSLRGLLPARHADRVRARVGAERRSRSRAGGARRRDTLSAHPGRARRDPFGSLARRTRRHHRQGRRRDRTARRGTHGDPRQDGDAHPRDAGDRTARAHGRHRTGRRC